MGHRGTFTGDRDTVLIAPLWAARSTSGTPGPDRAIEFACRVAGRDFTEDEWADHFGDRPYQHVCPQPDA